MPRDGKKCTKKAAHCDQLAERAHDEQARISLIDAAASWRELASGWLELARGNSE